jgi:hypothetical protein
VPAQGEYERERERATARDRGEEIKPLPPPRDLPPDDGRPPFDDVPLVSQRPPEQRAFLDAYRHVGSPRITLFVNRTPDANITPVYGAVESIMTDWLAANGQVTLISPTVARQRLTDQQVKELQDGRSTAPGAVAQQLGADVLIQVRADPTRQTQDGQEVRLIAEAVNTRGGQSIGRAVVDVPPPLEKTTINRYTRYLARKLMADMTDSWMAPPPPPPAAAPGAREGAARDAIPERTVVTPEEPPRPAPVVEPVEPPATAPPSPATTRP